MTPFRLYFERKQRNPLRKEELITSGKLDILGPDVLESYKEYYRKYPIDRMEDTEDKVIKLKYDNLIKSSVELAEKYLDTVIKNLIKSIGREKTKSYKKIYDYQGVQVFLDEDNVNDTNYGVGSYNYRMVKHSVLVMLTYIRDILPNKSPKIVITSLKKNPFTKSYYNSKEQVAGMAGDKLIFIDEMYIDENALWVHEYAHWVVDLIPTQTQSMMISAFEKFLDIYYIGKHTKPKNITKRERYKIAKHLGFPEYGLTDHNEFFAVLIENWKQLPNNKFTYKFKSLVKNILARL
jgi:hypothetical protein